MNWQLFSMGSCFLFGVSAILASLAAKGQTSLATLASYGMSYFMISLMVTIFKWKEVAFSATSTVLALAGGACAITAVALQLVAFGKWPERIPWIVLIGALYPTVVLVNSLVQGQRFSLTQWLGILLAIAAIILISLPNGKTVQ